MAGQASGSSEAGADRERTRLGLLQESLDPTTLGRLERLPVAAGWRCLEVGAGAGSIARWLAGRVGARGAVVATDVDTRFLGTLQIANLVVRQHDILADPLERDHYDLVHCRAVLMHLPDPARAVATMAAAVRPGGWLMLEEVDCGAFGAVDLDDAAAQRFDRLMRGAFDALRTWRVIDLYFGRRLPGLLERAGMADLTCDGVVGISRGGDPAARFQQMGLAFLGGMVSAGAITEDDLELLHRLLDDPVFAFVGAAFFGAWGRRTA